MLVSNVSIISTSRLFADKYSKKVDDVFGRNVDIGSQVDLVGSRSFHDVKNSVPFSPYRCAVICSFSFMLSFKTEDLVVPL